MTIGGFTHPPARMELTLPTAGPGPRPTEEDLPILWWVSIVMFGAAGLTVLAVLAAPDPDTSDHGRLFALAGLNLACALGLWAGGPRRILVRAAPLWGILVIGACVAVARPLGAVSLFYLWPLLTSAYFLSTRELMFSLALAWSTFAAALALWSPPALRLSIFMATTVAITVIAMVARVQRERRENLLEQLRGTAATDSLTGLLNRRAFDLALARELELARRNDLPLTLGIFDLDAFKLVNDLHGHAAGDDALVRFAGVLRHVSRLGDIAARIGGDEFVVVLPGTGPEGALRFAHRVVGDLGAQADREVAISVSAGLTGFCPDRDDSDALLKSADAALYEAKAAGRGSVVLSGASPDLGRAGDGGALERPADLVDRDDSPQAALAVHGEERAGTP